MEVENFNFPATVIGAGCIGSNLVPFLVRMGLKDIRVFDPDTVEEHNLRNQIYRPKDIGRKKVDSLTEIIYEMTGIRIVGEDRRIENEYLESLVICGVDSMESRRTIWENSIRLQPQIDLYIEARVGGAALKVYTLDPTDLEAIRLYEENLHEDPSISQTDCPRGEIPTLAAVVSVITSAVRDFARNMVLPRETIIDLKNWYIISQ